MRPPLGNEVAAVADDDRVAVQQLAPWAFSRRATRCPPATSSGCEGTRLSASSSEDTAR
jgi:hypothetical protein